MSTTTIAQLAAVVDRAATDPAFRQELLSDPEATLEAAGVSIPPSTEVRVAENSANLANLVLPARPSGVSDADLQQSDSTSSTASDAEKLAAYAKLVIQSWTDGDLKADLLQDPVATLKAHGITIPASLQVRVLEAAQNVAYLVVPPATTATSTTPMYPAGQPMLLANGGVMYEQVTTSFTNVAALITASSYLAGSAYAVAQIEQFKMASGHTNPTEVPISTPMALLYVATALVLLAKG